MTSYSSLDTCKTCGADLYGATGLTPLEEHILDHSDPHGTLSLVPRTWFGTGAPSVATGYRKRDWYVDMTSHVSYVYAVENSNGVDVPYWVRATPDVGVDRETLDSVLLGYVTSSALDRRLSSYVTSDAASIFATKSDLVPYVTSSYLATALSGYAKIGSLSGYVTTEAMSRAIASSLSGYVTDTALSSALAGYLTETAADGRYVSPLVLSDYAKASDVSSSIAASVSGKVFRHPLEPGVYPELDLDNILEETLSAYLTKEQAATVYVRPSDISGFLDAEDLHAALEPYVTSNGLSSVLSGYLATNAAYDAFVTPAGLSEYAKTAYVDSSLKGTVFRNPLTDDSYPTLDLDNILSEYLTSDQAAKTYVAQKALDGYPTFSDLVMELSSYVTEEGLKSSLSNYVTGSVLASELSNYASLSDLDTKFATRDWVAEWVPKQGFSTTLDAWPVSSVTTSNRPPTSDAVYRVTSSLDARLTTVENFTTSDFSFLCMIGNSDPNPKLEPDENYGVLVRKVEGDNDGNYWKSTYETWIVPHYHRVNYILFDSEDSVKHFTSDIHESLNGTRTFYDSTGLANRLKISLGHGVGSGGSLSFRSVLCLRFVVNDDFSNSIPWSEVLFSSVNADTNIEVLGLEDAADLSGTMWGDTVVMTFVEVVPNVYTIEKKVYHAHYYG